MSDNFSPLNLITDNRISNIMLSNMAGPIIPQQYTKKCLFFALAQSDPIKRRTLYLSIKVFDKYLKSLQYIIFDFLPKTRLLKTKCVYFEIPVATKAASKVFLLDISDLALRKSLRILISNLKV